MCRKCTLAINVNHEEMGTVSVESSTEKDLRPIFDNGYTYEIETNSLVRMEAKSNDGYHFERWNDGETQPKREIKVKEDIELIALFAPNEYTISVKVEKPSWGTVEGSGVCAYGTRACLTAIPNAGYRFKQWNNSSTGNIETDQNSYVFNVKEAKYLTAVFEENTKAHVTIETNDINKGITIPESGEYLEGQFIQIEAKSKMGYVFSRWDDGVKCNPRIIKASDGLKVTAFFEEESAHSMFDSLLNHTTNHCNTSKPCPASNGFKRSPNNHFHVLSPAKSVIKDLGEESVSHWRKMVGFFLLLAIFAAFLFVPIKCTGQHMDSLVTINSVKTNIPIKESLKGYNHIYARSITIDSTYYFSKDTGNHVRQETLNPSNDKVTVHGEIHYNNTSWYFLLYCLLIAIIVLTAVVFSIKFIIPIWSKRIDYKQKYQERRYNDYIRLSDEDREYERLQSRTELAIYEKREKARIDEWQRDNEHQRKLDIMEQERIANLSNVLVELAKTKNTVTMKDPHNDGKTITIERSILSDDFCEELKDILINHISQSDDCCDKIKDALKCLFGDPIDCGKVKNALKCVFCGDGDNKRNDELVDKIDRLITRLQSTGSNGVQQVVNIGGNEKSSSGKVPSENNSNN